MYFAAHHTVCFVSVYCGRSCILYLSTGIWPTIYLSVDVFAHQQKCLMIIICLC